MKRCADYDHHYGYESNVPCRDEQCDREAGQHGEGGESEGYASHPREEERGEDYRELGGLVVAAKGF